MFKRLLAAATFVGLSLGLVGNAPADCSSCPPPTPPPCTNQCGLQGILLQTDICLPDRCDCSNDNCHSIKVRFLEECSPFARVIDQVCVDWCDCFCEPVVGANGIVTVEQVDIVDRLATVVFRVEAANPLVFPDGFFGDVVRGFEVTLDGKCVIGCAALTCDLQIGSEFSIDWDMWGRSWFLGIGATKISSKASAKSSLKVSSSGKVSAKASAKASLKISGKGWKISLKSSAKASVKVGKSGISAKASAKSSIKIKGAVPFALSPFALAVAQAGAGPLVFGGAFANAWSGVIGGPGAIGVAGVGGLGAVAVAGFGPFPFMGCSAGRFIVLDVLGNCEDCDCCCQPPDNGPCAECDGKVTKLTLRYTGAAAATIVASGNKSATNFFSGTVQPGATFSFQGTPTMGTNLYLSVNGTVVTRIHTSCSQPIGPQMAPFGDFVIVAGESLNGGPMCPLPGATQANHGIP